MHRAHVPKEWIDSYLRDEAFPLPAESVTRFFPILRLGPKEEVAVFDGHGRQVVGLLVRSGQSAIFSRSRLEQEEALKPSITLVQAAIAESKMAEAIKRSFEFGVGSLIIFRAKNSEKYTFDKLKKRKERLESLGIDACRQSGRLFVPKIEFIEDLSSAISKIVLGSLGIFGDLKAQSLLSEVLLRVELEQDITIIVGPEGGLAHEENENLIKAQFIPVRWAPYILRTEFASLAPLSMINARLKRA